MNVPSGIFLEPAKTPIQRSSIKLAKERRKGAGLRTPTFHFGLSDADGNFATLLDNLNKRITKRSELEEEESNNKGLPYSDTHRYTHISHCTQILDSQGF